MLMALVLFFIEFFLFNVFGRNWMPNLLLILILFVGLEVGQYQAWGIALFGGFIEDSYSINPLGIHMVSFLVCAFIVLLLKRLIYHETSYFSCLLMMLIICVCNFVIQYLLRSMNCPINFTSALKYVMLPELIITLLVTTVLFKQIKKCALKLFV